jgi:nucleotide-binding universal stress UspA family protein
MAAYERDKHRDAEAILVPVKASAEQLGLEIEAIHVPDRRAARAILDTAHKCGCDVIVMASHGRTGMSRVMLGSHTAEVLACAEIPVIVYR